MFHKVALPVCLLSCLTLAHAAEAQLANSCLRPLAIPDKWVENQTPPWDPSDTFYPYGATPDVYSSASGYDPAVDDGRTLTLSLSNWGDLSAGSALPVDLPRDPPDFYTGASRYRENFDSCAGAPISIGTALALEPGSMIGPTAQAIVNLIARDPNAQWDAVTRTVINSAFAQSPRVLALPVFDTVAFEEGRLQGLYILRIVKIVGFFVDSLLGSNSIVGYLTARGTLSALPSRTLLGDTTATLSARVDAPGGGMSGVPVDFSFDGAFAGTAATGLDGTAVLPNVPIGTRALGTYPGVVSARLGTGAGFLLADDSSADLTVERIIPTIAWSTPAPIVYGTPLGPTQLNATASVPGQFFYSPPAATVLHAGVGQTLSLTFVPDDLAHYQNATATVTLDVLRQETTTLVASGVNPSEPAEPISVSVTVTSGYGIPTGFVELFNGPTSLGVKPLLANGTVAFDLLDLTPGTYPLHATYSGWADYAGSASPVLTQLVAPTIVLWASNVPVGHVVGKWQRLGDATAAGGSALWNPNAGKAKIAPALAAPATYFETTFTAAAGVPYHLWVRMRAQSNSLSNDSVHVQFSDAVTALGSPTMRIGTTSSAEFVLRNGPSDPSDRGWGWADNGWGGPGAPVYFAASGMHTVRVQQREDGAIVDQIVISPVRYLSSAPGPRDYDATILPFNDGAGSPSSVPPAPITVVLWSSNVRIGNVIGKWQRLADASAASASAVWNPNAGQKKIAPALAAPASYFETTFTAVAGTTYHIWIRLRAQSNSLSNDSVHAQFSDTVTALGSPTMRIGTTSSAEFVLQNGPGDPSDQGWGWADNGWGTLGSHIYFATTGTHTVRVQQREDGAIVDQIVISPDTYLTSPPGPRDNDATVLPAQNGSGL